MYHETTGFPDPQIPWSMIVGRDSGPALYRRGDFALACVRYIYGVVNPLIALRMMLARLEQTTHTQFVIVSPGCLTLMFEVKLRFRVSTRDLKGGVRSSTSVRVFRFCYDFK